MPIKVTCPKCQGVLHAPDDAGGKRGKCPTCGTVLSIPEDPARATANTGSRAAADPFDPSGPAVGAPPMPNRGSGLGMSPEPPPPPPARAVAPPAFGNPAPQRLPDPFARPGKKPARSGDPSDGLVRAWKRTRRGLWWVGFALFLFLLAPLAHAGIGIADKMGVKLPSQMPGFLQIQHLSSEEEIRLAATVGPVVLGLFFLLLGRFGVSNAPRSSYGRGLAAASALATLGVVLGLICYAVPTTMILVEKIVPDSLLQLSRGVVPNDDTLLPANDPSGLLQRAGLFVMALLIPFAELWFVIALGRMGAGLHNDRLAGRGTRFLIYIGLLVILSAVWSFVMAYFPTEVNQFYSENVKPQWDKLGENKATASLGMIGFAGLVVWFWNVRLVTGARRAIREWLDQNEPGA